MGDAVCRGIFLRVADGVGDDLDADDALRFPCEAEGDGAGAAVRVDDRFLPRKICKIEGGIVEHFRLLGIDLEERVRRHFESEPAQGGRERLPPPEAADLRAEDDVARPALHIVVEGDQFRQGVPHFPDPFFFTGKLRRGGDDDCHKLPAVAYAAHDVAHAACMGLLIVRREAVLVHERFREDEKAVVRFLLNSAGQGGDDRVAPLPVIAEAHPPAGEAYRDGHLVPVAEGVSGGEHGPHDVRRIAANLRDRAGGTPPFRLKLARIGEVRDLAAAAGAVDRAGRDGPLRRGREDLGECPHGIGFLHQRHAGADGLAGERARDEESEAFVFADAFAVDAQIVDGQRTGFAGGDGDGRIRAAHLSGSP